MIRDVHKIKYLCMANSVDPVQMMHSGMSDLGLHCLQRPICLRVITVHEHVMMKNIF